MNEKMAESATSSWSYLTYDPVTGQWRPPANTWRIVGKKYINLILFIATVASTWLVGGPGYCIAIIAILTAHEMGHFLMCRKYGVPATLPYFIPFPFPGYNPFGTMGALISMRGYIPSRKALFAIGAGGPLAGLVVTIPVLFIGLALSSTAPHVESAGGMTLGEYLLFKLISLLVLGHQPDEVDIMLHPVAYAGWAGLFITALNLIPVGQLDGGHVTYALLGPRAKYFTWLFIGALGILTINNYSWALLFLLLAIFGRRHPSPLDDYTPLDRRRRIIGGLVMILFLLSFTPVPFKI